MEASNHILKIRQSQSEDTRRRGCILKMIACPEGQRPRFYRFRSHTLFVFGNSLQLVYEARRLIGQSKSGRFFNPIPKRFFVPIILETTPRPILSRSVGL